MPPDNASIPEVTGTLDDILMATSDAILKAEIERRRICREAGVCDFCGEYASAALCQKPERHRLAQRKSPHGHKQRQY